ncbi:MAG: PilN domain-containing protein [Armatimonadetes bacterium]|nr:PilN domain-containing protein [Armatimonadota bacterium]
MPSVNMIAPRRAEKLRSERDMKRLVFAILAELVIAVVMGGWMFTSLFTTSGQISTLDAEISKLQPVVKQIMEFDTARSKLQPKLKLLNDAKSITMRWYNTLDMLTQTIPVSAYLTDLNSESKVDNTAKQTVEKTGLVIRGVTDSQALVGETMMRIQSIPDLANVQLHYSRSVDMPSGNGPSAEPQAIQTIEFELGSELQLGDAKGAKNDNQS